VRDQRGALVPVDDPRIDPVGATAAELKLPVTIHVADPWPFLNARPLQDSGRSCKTIGCISQPALSGIRSDLSSSFANLIARHPQTTFIGAHVACYAEN